MFAGMYVHQAINHPQGVTAFGSHTLGVDPDRARIVFSVLHIAGRPDDAYGEVEKLRLAVGAVLAQHQLPLAQITISCVSMEHATEGYGKDYKVLGYRARLDYAVTAHELTSVSALVVDLVDAGAHTIRSVTYTTSRLRELRARAREQAFASAQIKADGYARAAGLRVGRVLHIEDVNPDSIKERGHGTDVDLTSHDEVAADTTGSITIAGAVMACFALVEP